MDRQAERAKSGPACSVSVGRPARSSWPRRFRRPLLLAALCLYHTSMGVEFRIRSCLCRSDVLLITRSFIDDLASIAETLNIADVSALIRWAVWLFPIRKVYFLSAGDNIEYARILDVDLTREFHRCKGERYRSFVRELEQLGAPVRRIETGSSGVGRRPRATGGIRS
jgi:hypothetical protein